MPAGGEEVFSLNAALDVLREMGVFDVILPFLLIFSVIYGILESVEIFEDKGINATIAMSMGFLATGSAYFTGTLKSFTPFVGIILFFLLSFLVVMGLVAGSELENLIEETWFQAPIILISAAVLLFTFGASQNFWGFTGGAISGVFNSTVLPLIIVSVVLIAFIFIVVSDNE